MWLAINSHIVESLHLESTSAPMQHLRLNQKHHKYLDIDYVDNDYTRCI